MTSITRHERARAINAEHADQVRSLLRDHDLTAIDYIGPRQAGKSLLITRTVEILAPDYRIMVLTPPWMVDAAVRTIGDAGGQVRYVPLAYGTEHLDAGRVLETLRTQELGGTDVVFIENVDGLLDAPHWDLGETATALLFPVTAAERLPHEYPDAFRHADCLIMSRVDELEARGFEVERALRHARAINPDLEVFMTSALTGEGLGEWYRHVEGLIGRERKGSERTRAATFALGSPPGRARPR